MPICRNRWVDDPLKEKSRYVICEHATYKDRKMFAAASEHNLSRLVAFKYPAFLLEVTPMYTRAVELELWFLETPPKDRE